MTRLRIIALIVAVLAPAGLLGVAAAQTATPAPAGCTTAPRTDAELAQLGATPAASPTPTPQLALPAASPVAKDVAAGLQKTLEQVTACRNAGKVNSVLALYTDAYVANVALAPEPVPIVAGTPASGESAIATPAASPSPALTLVEARPDKHGRLVALVVYGAAPHVFVFAQEDGVWKIDQTADLVPALNGGSDSLSYPAPVVAVRSAAAAKLNAAVKTLTLYAVESESWPDSSLGCPQPGHFYAQVITSGYLVLIGDSSHTLEYHTDTSQNIVLCHSYGD